MIRTSPSRSRAFRSACLCLRPFQRLGSLCPRPHILTMHDSRRFPTTPGTGFQTLFRDYPAGIGAAAVILALLAFMALPWLLG